MKLEASVIGAPSSPQTEALYQATIATVHQAREARRRRCATRSPR